MITNQEQHHCDQLHGHFSAGSQKPRPIAAPSKLASYVSDIAHEVESHADPRGREHGEPACELLKRGQETRSKPNIFLSATASQNVDLRSCLESWPYDPACNVRIAFGADGRQIILVRQPMGLQQFELDGRPDGSSVAGEQTILWFHHTRRDEARRSQMAIPFDLTAGECAELFREAIALNHRLVILVRLKDWIRVKRDAAQILDLLDFVGRHARCIEDRVLLEPWRPHISRIDLVADAMAQIEQGDLLDIPGAARDAIGVPESLGDSVYDFQTLAQALMENVEDLISQFPAFLPPDEPGFLRQDDFWTIRYHGRSAFLKSNKGLECLACLLRSPGREFHVSELVACHSEDMKSSPRRAAIPRILFAEDGGQLVMSNVHDGISILDSQAKAECKSRLDDLRDQEDEAERFNDPDRAARARAEIDAIANYLATAAGLGGRDRRTSSEAERARCAVTKRIKQAIQRISAAIPELGQHLTARIKTGYFCSYNPHPDRPVAWKF